MIITAAVCTYDRYDTLPDVIRSLCGQSLPQDAYQILVVDNSPDEAKAAAFAADFAGIANLRILHVDRPGLAHARNVAVRECVSPYLGFIDDDALAAPDWLERTAQFFDRTNPEIAAVGGPVDPLWEAPRPSWLHDDLLGYLALVNWGDQEIETAPLQFLFGTNVAYRVEAAVRVGPFRTDLGRRGRLLLSNEEGEFHNRLRAAGYRLYYSPHIRVTHRVPKHRLTQAWFRQRTFWQVISTLLEVEGPNTEIMESPARPETRNPTAFNIECHQIVNVLRAMSAGQRVID